MENSMLEATRQMKADSYKMAALSVKVRNNILANVITALLEKKEDIFAANKKDMDAAVANGISESVIKRLRFDEHKLNDVISGIKQLVALPDPINNVVLKRELDTGLVLNRVTCPIGVIGIIFEARPDALVQISSLCIKSGNCAVLKGGKETANTNEILFKIIYETAVKCGAPKACMLQATAHSEIDDLLACNKSVDLLIPRGSNAFVQYIMNNTKIPVMGHADGICHTYVDKDADIDEACRVVVDAKTQYTAACNATETLLIDKNLDRQSIVKLCASLKDANVLLRGPLEINDIYKMDESMDPYDFSREYLSMVISVKLVDGVDEAIEHINRYGSHHTDAIITENDETAEKFMALVDSAGTYKNCSTRFADGFRYGFGAEVGISTSKIHARGPVGLEGLTTYKYKLYGDGHIVAEYADGQRQFKHRDLI